MRQNKLGHRVFQDYPHIANVCCDAWTLFANDLNAVASITKRSWVQVDQ